MSFCDHILVPDLDDPATIGCLLRLVREVLGDPVACVEHLDGLDGWGRPWRVTTHVISTGSATTEAEALVIALERSHSEGLL